LRYAPTCPLPRYFDAGGFRRKEMKEDDERKKKDIRPRAELKMMMMGRAV